MPFLAHAVAHCATCRAAKTGTDSGAVLATQRAADHRTAGSANATADSRLGAVTLVRTGCATGRTRDTGATTVIFISAANGVAVFKRQDVEIISQKTTLNSTPTVISTGRKASDVIVLPAFTPRDQIGQMHETTFTLSAAAGRNAITIDGHTLTLLAVQGGQIIYKAN